MTDGTPFPAWLLLLAVIVGGCLRILLSVYLWSRRVHTQHKEMEAAIKRSQGRR